MRTWLHSVVDTILGKIPGKTSRLDTATRMALDADFSHRREPELPEPPCKRERDDRHLVKPLEPSADITLFEQLVRIVNEAQDRDAEGCMARSVSLGLCFVNRGAWIPGRNSSEVSSAFGRM
jgi:hypothetical protein